MRSQREMLSDPGINITAGLDFANRLLASLNQHLNNAAPEKKEAVSSLVWVLAREIYLAFQLKPSLKLLNISDDKTLESCKLFDTKGKVRSFHYTKKLPWTWTRCNPEALKARIYAVCAEDDIMKLIISDIETLVDIPVELIRIIEQYLREFEYAHNSAMKIDLAAKPKIIDFMKLDFQKNAKSFYCGGSMNTLLNAQQINPYPEKHYQIKQSFFGDNKHHLLNHAVIHPEPDILAQLQRQDIQFNHQHHQNQFDHVLQELRKNLHIVKLLLALYDEKGQRLLPLTQENLRDVVRAIVDHDVSIKLNKERLERLSFLCSKSRKFASDVTVWMRSYQQHCVANDTAISFPELLLTYCANFPDEVDNCGPLPLQTLCALALRDSKAALWHNATARQMVDEESVKADSSNDSWQVVGLLSCLVNGSENGQYLRLRM